MDLRSRFARFHISNRAKYTLVVLAFVLLAGTAAYHYSNAQQYQARMELTYQRAFSEMVTDVNNIDANLQKMQLVSSAKQISNLASEIWRHSASAKANLGQLPTYHIDIQNTSKFLSQAGEFAYSLSSKVLDDGEITPDEQKTLADLSKYADGLNSSLQALQSDIYMGTAKFAAFDKLNKQTPAVVSIAKIDKNNAVPASVETDSSEKNRQQTVAGLDGNLKEVEKEFNEYPSLIYDGPFSDHLEKAEPEFTKEKEPVYPEIAQEKANAFLRLACASEIRAINLSGTTNSNIETYAFTAKTNNDGENIDIDITKKGGEVLYMINGRSIGQPHYKISDAIDKVQKLFEGIGINGMKDNYYTVSDNVATINFAYVESNVTIYPDIIRVMVALDNCEVVGYESRGYIMNHKTRSIGEPKINEQTAKMAINQNLTTNPAKLAIIPTNWGNEIFCYEFSGKAPNGKSFLIYVNCETGREENILLLLQSDTGTLTI